MKNFIKRILGKGDTQSVYARVSEDPEKGVSHESAGEIQKDVLSRLKVVGEDEALAVAGRLIVERRYEEAVEAHKYIALNFPAKKDSCHMNIGACYFFLGDYSKAVEHYLISKENGMNEEMIDDNVWEACEAHYWQSNTTSMVEKYLELFPQGSHIKEAKSL